MKVLIHLMLLSLLLSSSTVANETDGELDAYISKNKKQQFLYDYEKNEAESSKLRDSWIAPLRMNYSYGVSNPSKEDQTTQSASIKMDQSIFQSGGIYYGIKFANASKKYSDYSIDVAKRKMIKDAVYLLMQIKQTDLKQEKQKLQIKNSEINLELKKEQYLNGQLDSGFLDNAIIERNFVIQNLYDIQTSKERLVSSFNALSDLNYADASVPHLNILSEDEFLKHNIILKVATAQIQRDEYNKNMTVAKYLPNLSVTAGYNWSKSENQIFGIDDNGVPIKSDDGLDYYDYGIRASMPLDINTFKDIESAQVDFLKSKVLQEDKVIQLKAIFEQVMQNIENLNRKKALSLENREIYAKLLQDTKDLFSVGYKTKYDIETLENSVVISEINAKIFEYDKQLELLTLYEMYIKN
ncbi:MAG: TolC family protein [Campylobacterota bacterium]|nr:TolC family protein [Campylobacterota bacterium]